MTTRPTQTDRLERGHVAVFVWNDCKGTPHIGAYEVVAALDKDVKQTGGLEKASTDWLAPFMGKTVNTFATVSAPEGNETPMVLVYIGLPFENGAFDVDHVTPPWFKGLNELRLEYGLPDRLRELLAA